MSDSSNASDSRSSEFHPLRPWAAEDLFGLALAELRALVPEQHDRFRLTARRAEGPSFKLKYGTFWRVPGDRKAELDQRERLSTVLAFPGYPSPHSIQMAFYQKGAVWQTQGGAVSTPALDRYWGQRHGGVVLAEGVASAFVHRALIDGTFELLLEQFTEEQADELAVAMDCVRRRGGFRG